MSRLDGWGSIAHRLTQHAGVEVSKDQARRWAQRSEDPLPVRRLGRMRRPRVVAKPFDVDEWGKREFGGEQREPSPIGTAHLKSVK